MPTVATVVHETTSSRIEKRQLNAAPSGTPLSDTWKGPLSTKGRYIVDANGNRFRLRGGNWHGASGTYNGNGDINEPANHHAGEMAFQTVLCLDRAPMNEIIQNFLNLGINTIRLPFSNQMIHTTDAVPDSAMAANPQLKGKTPLQIYDEVVSALTKAGIAVILNNHTVKSIWCCGLDQNARWNIAQSDKEWQDDWIMMVKRYKDNNRVVGAELYNEVRRDLAQDPTWGQGGSTDWYQASMNCAVRIQREANPDILIIIEGINWVGIPLQQFPHWRPELSQASYLSLTLPYLDKLVYSSHMYAYTGANNTGASSGPFTLPDPLYRDLSVSALNETMDRLAGYVATDTLKHYTAPVWISEFGSAGRYDTLTADRNWWHNFINYMIDRDLEFAVWPLVGWQSNGQGDLWALTAWDTNNNTLSISDNNGQADWRYQDWQRLMQAQNIKTGQVDAAPTFRMLFADNGNAVMSNKISSTKILLPGTRHAVCPDGLRLLGLTAENNPRGLCTDVTYGRDLWDAQKGIWDFVPDERHVTQDWAPGFTKLTCAPNQHLIGYSFTGRMSVGAYCAKFSDSWSSKNALNSTRVVFFDKQSNYPTNHGLFSAGGNTGACNDDEVAMGYAFSTLANGGTPAALLCSSTNTSSTGAGGGGAVVASGADAGSAIGHSGSRKLFTIMLPPTLASLLLNMHRF
ncbi:glycoside hydrolase family 5 protein [Tilletiaria anomala UBC 951]|uniref:Glycoside hydrolase family 5 protein n=1 Tax=Tilletiaria anomala (strain ATCC 24038 / CBS 436.72 / UBC 951) TaxID=1037660 RepID=A0A066VL81_TILAU|nr:glycoside hydrolase family 5 protein [Tilletiaria anomala UBC 951]KDN41058.1 glycoside hydrolase family 5 protein [Tilletiaria anomala UBC 951]